MNLLIFIAYLYTGTYVVEQFEAYVGLEMTEYQRIKAILIFPVTVIIVLYIRWKR